MSTVTNAKTKDCSIIALDRFIQATRDSGYRNTAAALSELVDNSIQAGATRIAINITNARTEDGNGVEVSVADNGCGMDPFTLRQALRFGGSTRFGDRSGLGRYGMGLPNASLSQARRVIVYTWQAIGVDVVGATGKTASRELAKRVCMSYLDVDEIVRSEMREVPRPVVVKSVPKQCVGASGTFVKWTQCDRLDNRRVSTIERKVEAELARRFRHYLRKRIKITINGDPIKAFDPLYLCPTAELSGASLFGEELRYEVPLNPSDLRKTGWVKVRFTELPVRQWHKFSNDEKRRVGISRGAGVSIVRAGREVDYGWFFMGEKSRENYDDWWRCEIQFDPALDDAFGITHTKQQIRPQAHLIEAITPDLEAAARALSARVRRAHQEVKVGDRCLESERRASDREHLLRPLPRAVSPSAKSLMRDLKKSHPFLGRKRLDASRRYKIIEAPIKDKSFFSYARDGEQLVLVLNPYHPFYRDIYKPLAEAESPRDKQLRANVELLLLAAARSEVAAGANCATIARQRLEWSHALAAFLNDK